MEIARLATETEASASQRLSAAAKEELLQALALLVSAFAASSRCRNAGAWSQRTTRMFSLRTTQQQRQRECACTT